MRFGLKLGVIVALGVVVVSVPLTLSRNVGASAKGDRMSPPSDGEYAPAEILMDGGNATTIKKGLLIPPKVKMLTFRHDGIMVVE